MTNVRVTTGLEVLYKGEYRLGDNASTSLRAVMYDESEYRPEIVVFPEEQTLLDWCLSNGASEAINAGFTYNHNEERPTELLGEYWVDGVMHPSVKFPNPRSGVLVDGTGCLKIIAPDERVSLVSGMSFFEAGPLLLKNGEINVGPQSDYEGFATEPLLTDDDWTQKRFPRSAIGKMGRSIITVTCDGYTPPSEPEGDKGMTLLEMAGFLVELGVEDAINADGGSRASHYSRTINGGNQLLNSPRGGKNDNYKQFPFGRHIKSAVILHKR